MRICGVQGISLIDFPGKIASVLFLGGCNFRCPFCQNYTLVAGYKDLPLINKDSALASLERRKGFIDGVVIPGGEPLIGGMELLQFLGQLRGMGFLTKLDTNGYNVDLLRTIIDGSVVDYIAMDVKTSPGKYEKASGRHLNMNRILTSIHTIRESSLEYEFRTTCVPGLVEWNDIEEIGRLIEGAERYYLQQFRAGGSTLDPSYAQITPYSQERLEEFLNIARKHVRVAEIRGI